MELHACTALNFPLGLGVPCRWWTPTLWRGTLHEHQDQMHPLRHIFVQGFAEVKSDGVHPGACRRRVFAECV